MDTDIAILGAGFSGSLLAVHLAGKRQGPRVLLLDKSRSHGAGLAFGAAGHGHLLNVPAGRMSAFPDNPGHFLEWLRERPEEQEAFGLTQVEESSFLPRRLYGRYLTWLVRGAADSVQLKLAEAEVTDLDRERNGTWRLRMAGGGTLTAGAVVLAMGNFPSARPPGLSAALLQSGIYLPSPWVPGAIPTLAKAGDVLLLGTGLTALDVVSSLRQAGLTGRLHLLSRRGLLPQAHKALPPHDLRFDWSPLPSTVRLVFRRVRQEIRRAAEAGVDWRAAVDSLRGSTQALWQGWSRKERARFLRHVRPWWEVARHRAAPQAMQALTELLREGLLEVHAGRLQQLEACPEGAVAVFRKRRDGRLAQLRIGAVLNCTGPETDLTRVLSPVVGKLIERQLITPDPLGLGMECAPDGSVRQADGNPTEGLYALGALRKGQLWETTAVPELRQQAAAMADLLHARWIPTDAPAEAQTALDLPPLESVWAYEI